jgi:16S rRNA C967 or C1407 C5-methylase (RsmB/RsmF family)
MTTLSGPDGFQRYYETLFAERWPKLRDALFDEPDAMTVTEGLTAPYRMDRASFVAARALAVRPGDRVVDLCAAPGGKTLLLALALEGRGSLFANDRSSARRARLHRVLEMHLPDECRRTITVTGHDAARWGVFRPRSADRVLADVPCSSERHVINSPAALRNWSESRTRRLARQAYAIACAAADSLVSGGRMVYSTCALSPAENDEVVTRLLARSAPAIVVLPPAERVSSIRDAVQPQKTFSDLPGRPTEHGWAFLPDADHGMGPIYLSILVRTD